MAWQPTREICRGQNNLQIFTDNLQDNGGEWQNATAAVSDAAIAQAQRWAKIQDLHGRIDKVEADALYQDDLVEQLDTYRQRQELVLSSR